MNHMKYQKFRRTHFGEKGSNMVLTIIVILGILGLAGLVLDYALAVWARAKMQKGADAAALAGAAYLPTEDQGVSKGTELLDQNYPDYTEAILTPGNNQFEVTVSDEITTYFMRLFGYTQIPVSVYAKAVTRVNVCGIQKRAFPFCLINPNTNNDPSDDLVPENYGKMYILGYGQSNINVPDWRNGSIPNWTPSDLGPAKGWRSALGLNNNCAYDPGVGAQDIAYAIEFGWCGNMEVDDIAPTRLGDMANPLAMGREKRLARTTLLYEDFLLDPEKNSQDARVILVPIISLINHNTGARYTPADFDNRIPWEHESVIIDGFAPFWLLSEEEQGDVNQNGKRDDKYYFTGLYLPPITINGYLRCDIDGEDPEFGVYATPRLVE